MIEHSDRIDFTPLQPDVPRAVSRITAQVERGNVVHLYLRRVAAVAGLSAAAAAFTFYIRSDQSPTDDPLESVMLNAALGGAPVDVGALLDAVEGR